MTYLQTLDYLNSIRMFGWKLGLEPMRALLQLMGNPQADLKFIHIAGTNGKGSVAAMCQALLTAAGHQTGLYTSPHLVSFCERFQIDGRLIPEFEVARLVTAIRPLAAQVAADPQLRELTFFEFVTALALQYFHEQGVGVVAWETGLGGRLDATNIVTPLVSVITSIGLDHMQYLGATIPEIAQEKCGIIKPGIPVVTAARRPEALAVIRAVCRERHSPLTVIDRPSDAPVALAGEHQRWNCATALAALRAAGFSLSAAEQERGLAAVVWPGRFQVIAGKPPVIVDGAHNPDAMTVLVDTLRAQFPQRRVRLIIGMLRDKDYARVCQLLARRVASVIYCVPVNSARSCDPNELAAICRAANAGTDVQVMTSVPAALAGVRAAAAATDVVLITGSLFLVGEALSHLGLPFGEQTFRAKELGLQ